MLKSLSELRFPAQYLEIVEAFAERRGIPITTFRAACALPAQGTGHPDDALDGEQLKQLLLQAARYARPDMPLSAQLLEDFPLTAHGTLGIVLLSSPNLNAALDAALRFYPLVMPACAISREDIGNHVHLVIKTRYDFGAITEALNETMIGAINSIRRHLQPTSRLLELHFDHPARFPLEAYDHFADPDALYFDQPCNKIVIPKQNLKLPLITSSRTTMQQFEQQLEQQLQALHRHTGLSCKIRERLEQQLRAGQVLSLEEAADWLNMSSRTLRRHLNQEGATFKDMVNEARLDYAEFLLLNSAKSVSQIAHAAGFTNDSAFSRAFRQRKSESPTALRQRLTAPSTDRPS